MAGTHGNACPLVWIHLVRVIHFGYTFNECNGVQHVVSGRYCALNYVSKSHQQACQKHNECMALLQRADIFLLKVIA